MVLYGCPQQQFSRSKANGVFCNDMLEYVISCVHQPSSTPNAGLFYMYFRPVAPSILVELGS